jgi:cobalamin biosynthesis Mg chelatase CobN
MRDKKKATPEKTPEQEALEKRVDAMMDPKRPDEPIENELAPPAEDPEPTVTAVSPPAADPPTTATTAPQLSPKLRKQIAVTEVPAQPLSIDKLDELTKSITESDTPKKTKKSADKSEKPDKQEESDEQENITEQSTDLDDAQTDEAVEDIVAYEGDVMLAVADSTAEERNRQAEEPSAQKGHPVFSVIIWVLVAAVVMLIIALCALLLLGDNLAAKLGL